MCPMSMGNFWTKMENMVKQLRMLLKVRIFVRPEIVIFIWETVPPPTHVWEKFPKKKTFFIGKIFFCAFPKI